MTDYELDALGPVDFLAIEFPPPPSERRLITADDLGVPLIHDAHCGAADEGREKMMKTMKRLWAMLSAVLFAVGLSVVAAQPAQAATVLTFDADGSALSVAASAADWSNDTGVTVVTGNCTGTKCVHFKVIPNTGTDWPCKQFGLPYHPGCAYRIADGGCQVEVAANVFGRGYLELMVTKHEAGHCVFSYGGKAASFHLPDEPHALMSAVQPGAPDRKDAYLTKIDRDFTRTLSFP